MKGNEIIASADPRGKFIGCIVSGTPVPGTCMEKVPATAPVNGRFQYRARSITAGSKGPVAILMADSLQGKLGSGSAAYSGGPPAPGDAYVDGKLGQIYFPVAGEDLNLPVASVSGTADDVAIGDLMGIDASGLLHANSAYTSAPFEANEAVTDPTAAYMLWVTYLGNNA